MVPLGTGRVVNVGSALPTFSISEGCRGLSPSRIATVSFKTKAGQSSSFYRMSGAGTARDSTEQPEFSGSGGHGATSAGQPELVNSEDSFTAGCPPEFTSSASSST